MKKLIVIAGPTAVGKTALSIKLAKKLDTAILSADSRQFYREMDIGTAKPTAIERAEIPHHFIDSLTIHQPYHVGDFEKEAIDLLNQLFQNHQHIILTGGSGLYIQAVCEGLDQFPEVPLLITRELNDRFEKAGLQPLVEELRKADSRYCLTADLLNPRRVIRALSVYYASGKPFSSFLNTSVKTRIFEPEYICLEIPRQELYERINLRVLRMMDDGLLEEAIRLFPYRHLAALQTVGYTELFDHITGKSTLEEAVTRIQQHTRNYAKRQMTWFKKYGDWKFMHPESIRN